MLAGRVVPRVPSHFPPKVVSGIWGRAFGVGLGYPIILSARGLRKLQAWDRVPGSHGVFSSELQRELEPCAAQSSPSPPGCSPGCSGHPSQFALHLRAREGRCGLAQDGVLSPGVFLSPIPPPSPPDAGAESLSAAALQRVGCPAAPSFCLGKAKGGRWLSCWCSALETGAALPARHQQSLAKARPPPSSVSNP